MGRAGNVSLFPTGCHKPVLYRKVPAIVPFNHTTMSQTLTIIALAALGFALLTLFLYFRLAARETAERRDRRPVPGIYFIPVLVTCTFFGMAVTEWQGVCGLSPWGFVAGIVLGLAAEFVAYRRSEKRDFDAPV